MIRHIVMWRLAADEQTERDAAAAEIARELEALVGVVPSLRSLSVHRNVAFPEANSDVVLTSEFDDVAGLEAYQVHPEHQRVAAIVRSHVASRASIDYEV